MSASTTICIGAVLGGLGVMLGAFGAHWLRGAVGEWGLDAAEQARRLEVWETAVRYQMYHALALVAVGILLDRFPAARGLSVAGWFFLVGVLIFSGLLYALVLSGVKVLGAIVPIGGTALIIGWLLLAWSAFRLRS